MIELLDLLEYYHRNPNEEVFCKMLENCGKGFATKVAKGLADEDEIEAFEANLPVPTSDEIKLAVNRVKADINNALMQLDNYREQTLRKVA